MPARLQVQVSGSQNTRQSQPQSSLDRRMARSSCFSSTSIFFTPEARSNARRFFVGRGWRKKYSSTSVLSRSISSSEMSSRVSVLASSDSTVPFFVICCTEQLTKSFNNAHTYVMSQISICEMHYQCTKLCVKMLHDCRKFQKIITDRVTRHLFHI